MRFTTVVETSNAVAATSSRKEKVALLAECLAGLPEAETRAGVGFLAGEPRQRPLGVGWATLRELPPPAAEPSLEVIDVDAAFDHVAALSGSGSRPRGGRRSTTCSAARPSPSRRSCAR